MRQPPKSDPVPQPRDSENTIATLMLDMADTTWRMFVPIVGLLLVGRYVDTKTGTKPLLMLMGAFIGSLIAWALIRKQLKKKY
jgi:hypothetical protein